MKVIRENPKALEKLRLNLKELEGLEGKVGWFETARYENGLPVAQAAQWNEFGTSTAPARPFMRPTAIEQKASWAETAAQLAKQVLKGVSNGFQAMQILTLKAQGDVGKTIANLYSPPLSPVSIELRAMKKRDPGLVITARTVGIAAARVREPGYVTPDVSTKPLNDTGHMINTLSSVVEKV